MSSPGSQPPPTAPGDPSAGLAGPVVRGAGISAIGFGATQVINLAAYIVLARLLVPEEFGVFAAATILLGLAQLATESGMASAVVQRRDRLEEAANTALIATFISGIAIGVLAVATAPLLGLIFDDSQVTEVAAVMAGTIFLRSILSVPYALLQRRLSMARRLVIEPLAMVAFAVSAIIAADNGLGVWALVIAQYASTIVDVVLSWALVRWRPHLRLASMAMWRELVGYSRHVFSAAAIYSVGWQLDSIIVGNGLGTAALGQFRYGLRLATLPFAGLLAAASYVLFPTFAEIFGEPERFRPAFIRTLQAMSILAFPLGFILVPLGVPLAVVVFGEIWREAGYAAAAMCAYPAGGAMNSIVSETLKASGKPRPLPLVNAVWIGGTLALMAAALPFGFRAVAAAISVAALIGGVFGLAVASRAFAIPLSSMLRVVWPPALAASVMAGVLLPVEAALDTEAHAVAVSLALLLGQAIAGLAVFVVVLRLCSRDAADELATVLHQLSRKIRRR